MKLFWNKTPGLIKVKIDRDSVHAGDDFISHAAIVRISPSASIAEFLEQVRKPNFYPTSIGGNITFLPGIKGGNATWLIDCGGIKGKCIGVIAAQWQEAKLTLPADTPLKSLLLSNSSGFYFRYWCQADPEIVFSCVLNGKDLPNKYG